MKVPKTCPCGSKKPCEALYDARGIFCAFVCDDCEEETRKRYRSEIFTNSNYVCNEPVEPEN